MFKQRFLDSAIQQHITLFAGERSTFHAGAEWILHHFRDESHYAEREDIYPFAPNDAHERLGDQPFDRVQNRFDGSEQRTRASRLGGYASGNIYLGDVSIHPGVRYEYYTKGGHHSMLPRLNVRWQVDGSSLSVAAGYGEFSQYVHIVGLDMARFPSDRWFWSDETREPLRSKMATFGIGYELFENTRITIEGYYKDMKNLLSYNPVAERDALEELETLPIFTSDATVSGDGHMYGVELDRKSTRLNSSHVTTT